MQVQLSLNQSCNLLRNANAGQTLFQQGDDSGHVYELYSGIVRGVTISEEGDRSVVGFFFAGDQIGLPLSGTYRFSAETVTGLNYVCQTDHQWRRALVESCRSDGHMLHMIRTEQDAFYRRGELMSCPNVLAQVAAFLVSVIERLPRRDEIFDFPLPQIDIADYLAISPETVCRSLRKLRDMGVIGMPSHGSLMLIDPKMLDAIAHDRLLRG